MINLTYEDNASLYFDYRLGLELLRNVRDEDYNYPDEIVNFHIYTEVKNNKELECVKSFLATQNLEKTRLVIWSDYEIYDNPLLQPYKHLITFKVYNAREEAVGTPMEHEHTMLDASDSKYYLKSDLFRLMILHKYGGVWADMDIVFLRDFKQILDQEYMYKWGGDTDFAHLGACATVLAMHKQSEFSYKMLDVVKTMPALGDTTVWGKDTFAKLWREWPHFTIFPSTFFNTEWLISKVDRILSEDVENDWFYNKKNTAKDHLFLEAFTWHWHNSSKKTFPIEEGSKFDLLRKRTDALLYKKGIL